MALNKKQIQYLKSLAHHLNPVVMIGNNGLIEGVLAEIEQSLSYHELIKIKIASEDRESRNLIANAIVRETDAINLQIIGKILILYRPSEIHKIILPNISFLHLYKNAISLQGKKAILASFTLKLTQEYNALR